MLDRGEASGFINFPGEVIKDTQNQTLRTNVEYHVIHNGGDCDYGFGAFSRDTDLSLVFSWQSCFKFKFDPILRREEILDRTRFNIILNNDKTVFLNSTSLFFQTTGRTEPASYVPAVFRISKDGDKYFLISETNDGTEKEVHGFIGKPTVKELSHDVTKLPITFVPA